MSSPSSAEVPTGPDATPRRVALIGSTGSIGRQAVDVLVRHPDAFRVVALAAGTNGSLLAEQAAQLRPAAVALGDAAALAGLDLPPGTDRLGGSDALEALATRDDVDLVVIGTGGVVSLRPVLAALRAGKVVATANKETLVAGGHLVMPLARALAAERAATDPIDPYASPLAWLRPIDSEHSAIWQCLVGETMADVAALVLTASGGPFLDATPAELDAVTPEQALKHPTWSMGAKITIDSATLANKGLEVIEAHWLYDVALRRHRGRHPPAERRPLRRPIPRRLPEGPVGHPGHATTDPIRADLSQAPAVSGDAARPARHRPPRLPRARRGTVPGPADRS